MKTKNLVCIGLILLLLGAAEVWADTVYTWTGTAAGDDWLNPSNWSPNGQPIYTGISGQRDTAIINTLPGATLSSGTGGAWALEVGYGGAEGRLDLYGGGIKAPGGLDVAFDVAESTGTLNIYGGTDHSARYLVAGGRGTGTVNMYGGFFRVTNALRIAYYSTATGVVNLEGGTLSIKGIYMPYTASMVIKDGILLYDGDQTAAASYLRASCIDTGKIVAADGYQLVLEYDPNLYPPDIATPGVTKLYAVAVPEPATLVLLAAGALVSVRKRMK